MRRLALFAAALAAWPLAAAAEEDTTLSEVVVTAAPYAVSVDSTTTSIDVVKRDDLDRAPPGGLGDVLAFVPGVRSSFFGPGASRPVIRGLSGARVMVLTNGVGQIDASGISPDHQVATDPQEARRIEVVRGPATLAYGGSAIGGVVNVIDDRIPQDYQAGLHGRALAEAGSVDGGRLISGAFSEGLGGHWNLTADGVHRASEDYRSARETIANTAVRLNAFGAGASYVGEDAWGGLAGKRTSTDYGSAAEPDVHIALRQTRFDARGGLNFASGPFSGARYSAAWADYRHTEFESGAPNTTFLSKGAEGRVEWIQRERNGWQGALGFQALKRDFDAIGDEALIPSTQIRETGAFALQRMDRGKWGLEGGLRTDRRSLDSLRGARSFTNVSGSVAAFVRPADGWFFGLSLSQTSRAPTEEELFSLGPHPATGAYEIGDADLDRETSRGMEASVHHSTGRWSLDGHLYHVAYRNFIDLAPTGSIDAGSDLPIFAFIQGSADFTGAEVEARYEAWSRGERSLTLEASGDVVRGDMLGAPALRTPPWSASLAADYDSPRLQARLDVRKVGAQNRVSARETPTRGYALVNASITLHPIRSRPDMKVMLSGENLTNQLAREHVSVIKDAAPLPGRNLRLGLGYRF